MRQLALVAPQHFLFLYLQSWCTAGAPLYNMAKQNFDKVNNSRLVETYWLYHSFSVFQSPVTAASFWLFSHTIAAKLEGLVDFCARKTFEHDKSLTNNQRSKNMHT